MPGTSQTVIWTALPNGTVPGEPKTLRLSVFVSPRLSPASGTPNPELHMFPDFLDWPATHLSWKVTIGGKTAGPAKVTSPGRRSDLWALLFPATTFVEPWAPNSLSGRRFHSHPAWYVRDFHASTYALYAHASTEYPTVETLFREGPNKGPAPYGKVPWTQDLEQVALNEIESMYGNAQFGALAPAPSPNPLTDLTQAKVFLQPLTVPKDPNYHHLKPTPKPTIDFHRMVSTLGEYPLLLRLFGLVFDLEVPLPTGLPSAAQVGVKPTWAPKLAATTNVFPSTGATLPSFLPQPRTSSPEISQGLLRLSDSAPGGQPAFPVIELELDGATLKTLNFAQGVGRTLDRSPVTTPQGWALPSLRSAGLALAHTGLALEFGQTMANTDAMNAAVVSSSPIALSAEDVTRGFRIDVWDDRTDKWHQLCARTAAPSPAPGGYAIGKAPHVVIVPVPHGDEGWVSLGVADGPQGGSSDTYLSETLLRWANWSLVAPRPGKHLSQDPSDGLESDQNNPPTGTFPLQVAYAATPGTLPVLRFGRSYRFRARAVDLAGNSVTFSSSAPAVSFAWATSPLRYGRLEPVVSPPVIPHDRRTPGEHLERLVIRSAFWNTPDSTVAASSRHVVPPSTTEEMAEAHGVLDLAGGRPNPAMYSVVASRAGLTYATASVLSSLGGKKDPDALDQPYYPVDNLEVPYLPDVLGRGALLQSLPGAPSPVDVSFTDGTHPWPAARAFRLVIKAGSGAPVKPTAANGHTLTVFAPKATFATVRLSCYLNVADLQSMGLWEWLEEQGHATAALEKVAASGRHYMFTPYRELVIVHAVRQPLKPPQFTNPVISRDYGKTFALLTDTIKVDGASSIKVDVLSKWKQPFDDGVNPAGSVYLDYSARVGELPLGTEQPPPTSVTTPSPGLRHDFGDTKYRDVFYEAQATTRFLEYFLRTEKVTLHGTAPTVVNAGGLATGATTVKSTGVPAVTYQPTVDYIEDDSAGTIARTPTSAIVLKNGSAEVEVSFVPPPVTRSSLEMIVPPGTSGGYPLSVPSSARPAAPDVRYVLPLFGFSTASSSTKVESLRRGNAIRVYLGRPWWSSGDGELLGVVVYQIPPGVGASGYPPTLEPFVTRYGRDPIRATNAVRFPTSGDFALATATGTGINLLEAASTGSPPAVVEIVGHKVGFDTTRQLWYSDIEIETAAFLPIGGPSPSFSYWPFVRLGLVRYQPASLPGVEVSRVVQADFVQIAPDRLATLTFPSAAKVRVSVAGVGYVTGPVQGPATVTATVEEEIHGVSDPDLKWAAVPKSTVTLPATITAGDVITWTGEVTLPAARGSRPFRIRIEEAEIYVGPGGGLVPNYVPRVTYIETLQI